MIPFEFVLRDGGGNIARGSQYATVVLMNRRGAMGIGWTYSDIWFEGQFTLPSPVIVAVSLIVPAWWGFRRAVKNRNSRQNLCRACSYDLTGNTSGVCPECGRAVAGDFNAMKRKERVD